MSISIKTFSIFIFVVLIGFIYCYYKINSLQDDLQVSENNNIILQQSINKQNIVIDTLKQSASYIQDINDKLNKELQNKDDALNNLNKSFIDLKNQYKQDPMKANKFLNDKIKQYNKCLNDITLNNINSDICKNFY